MELIGGPRSSGSGWSLVRPLHFPSIREELFPSLEHEVGVDEWGREGANRNMLFTLAITLFGQNETKQFLTEVLNENKLPDRFRYRIRLYTSHKGKTWQKEPPEIPVFFSRRIPTRRFLLYRPKSRFLLQKIIFSGDGELQRTISHWELPFCNIRVYSGAISDFLQPH